MEEQGVAPFDSCIPRVKVQENGTRRFAVIDAGEIIGPVGLLSSMNCAEGDRASRSNAIEYTRSSYRFVIRAGSAFPKNIRTSCGRRADLFIQ